MRLTPWTLYRNVLSAAMIGLAGLLAIQLFSVFLAIDVPLKRAFWTTLLVVLSPPILIFGALFFTELITALLCVFVFRVVAVERTASDRQWVLAGVATGLMVIVHARNLGLVLPLIAVAMWSVTQKPRFPEARAVRGAGRSPAWCEDSDQLSVLGNVCGRAAREGRGVGRARCLSENLRSSDRRPVRRSGVRPASIRAGIRSLRVRGRRAAAIASRSSDEDCVHRRLLPFRRRHADHQRARMDGRVVAGRPACCFQSCRCWRWAWLPACNSFLACCSLVSLRCR